jgi:CHAT domain-containing protein/tetratricopeptide (TPR) repeat protein
MIPSVEELDLDELHVLAELLLTERRIDEAEELFSLLARTAAATGSDQHLGWAYLGQATVALLVRDAEKAAPLIGRAHAAFEKTGSDEGMIATWQKQAEAALQTEDLAEAREALDRALSLYKELGDQDQVAAIEADIGRVAHGMGKLDEARARYQAALERATGDDDIDARRVWLLNLGLLERDAGHLRKAVKLFERCLQLTNILAERLPAGEARRGFLLTMLGPERELVRLCLDLGWRRKALAWLEASRDRGYGDRADIGVTSARGVPKRSCVAVTFFVYQGPAYAFVFDPGDPRSPVIVEALGCTGLELVQSLLRHPADSIIRLAVGTEAPAEALAAAMRDGPAMVEHIAHLVLEPVASEIRRSGASTLLVIPTDILHQVPLHIAARSMFSAEQGMDVVMAPSVVSIARTAPTGRSARPGILAVAGPAGQLPCSAAEARSALSQLGTGVLLEGSAANQAAVLGQENRHRIMHFACEASFGGQELERTVLELPGGERVSLATILDLEGAFEGVELVVLSACSSGRTRMNLTEDVLSIHGAFLKAGARGVIASMWRVPDAVCCLLMHVFYRHLSSGHRPPAALRETQSWAMAASRTVIDDTVSEIAASCHDEAIEAALRSQVATFLEHVPSERPLDNPVLWGAFFYAGTP